MLEIFDNNDYNELSRIGGYIRRLNMNPYVEERAVCTRRILLMLDFSLSNYAVTRGYNRYARNC